jgi:hypothetical protein
MDATLPNELTARRELVATLRGARAWQSQPILARLRRAMEVVRRRVLPQSLLGQAIDDTLSRWEA